MNAEIATLISDFSNEIDTIQKSKKGVAEAAKKFAEELIKHPILPYEGGEDRVLEVSRFNLKVEMVNTSA